jgi:hypothetical protein
VGSVGGAVSSSVAARGASWPRCEKGPNEGPLTPHNSTARQGPTRALLKVGVSDGQRGSLPHGESLTMPGHGLTLSVLEVLPSTPKSEDTDSSVMVGKGPLQGPFLYA